MKLNREVYVYIFWELRMEVEKSIKYSLIFLQTYDMTHNCTRAIEGIK